MRARSSAELWPLMARSAASSQPVSCFARRRPMWRSWRSASDNLKGGTSRLGRARRASGSGRRSASAASMSRVAVSNFRNDEAICGSMPCGFSPDDTSRSSCASASAARPSAAASTRSHTARRSPAADIFADELRVDHATVARDERELVDFLGQEAELRRQAARAMASAAEASRRMLWLVFARSIEPAFGLPLVG